MPKALDVLADMMCHAQFPADELEREKGVIIQEIKMYEDMPRSVCMHKWMERYYGDNSFGWSTLGPEDNIKAFTQDDFFKHKEALYTKDNLVLVIAGALPGKTDLENLIGELFATLPETKQLEEPLFPNHLPAEHEAFFDKQTQQNHLII